MPEPTWAKVDFAPIDYQAISYYSDPKGDRPTSLDEVDPELLRDCVRFRGHLSDSLEDIYILISVVIQRGHLFKLGTRQ